MNGAGLPYHLARTAWFVTDCALCLRRAQSPCRTKERLGNHYIQPTLEPLNLLQSLFVLLLSR